MEEAEECECCKADRTIVRDDLCRTGLHAARLSKELARVLEFHPIFHEDYRTPSMILPLGSIQHESASWPVVLLFARNLASINLDALFPSRMPHVVFHLEVDQKLITALQDRRMIPLYLSFLVEPMKDGIFKAKKTLSQVLRNYAPWPEPGTSSVPQNKRMLETILDEVKATPQKTAALFTYGKKRKMRVTGVVTENGFSASAHYTHINWETRTYKLSKGAARIIEALHIAHRSLGLPGMNQQEVFSQVYGSDKKSWPSGKTRIQNFFRTGDAKRLWDDGFISHDNKGNFRLSLPEDKALSNNQEQELATPSQPAR